MTINELKKYIPTEIDRAILFTPISPEEKTSMDIVAI